jgi:hypothetical protein
MLTIELIQVSTKKWIAKVEDWNSGPGILRATNRRCLAHLKALDNEVKRTIEAERYENSPKKKCPRCKGSGGLNQFLHVAHGICFKCGGSGEVEAING